MIRLHNISKQYSHFRLHCSLEIPKDRITALIGPNGAGKSTVFKIILGLITPDGGEVTVFGKPVSALAPQDRTMLGVCLSDSGFSGYLQIRDVIPVLSQMYPDFQKDFFLEKCRHFQLPLSKKIKELSSGMKVKLKILVALSHKARLLILDEPTTGLDVLAREEILDMLREYMLPGNRSILISSHISTDIEGFCDDLYLINEGKILLHEDTDIILDNYGILKVTEEKYPSINKKYVVRELKESYGYRLLTSQKEFYQENMPELTLEKCGTDDIIFMMTKGEIN